jgi:hypothetical protein
LEHAHWFNKNIFWTKLKHKTSAFRNQQFPKFGNGGFVPGMPGLGAIPPPASTKKMATGKPTPFHSTQITTDIASLQEA